MKYYLIAGEASGDLHASRLMRSLRQRDPQAEFRFVGGDRMRREGGSCLLHFKDIAYMGFVPVILHLPTILKARRLCEDDIREWKPDAVILVDYAGFNLGIARFLRRMGPQSPRIIYYISPKIWAWKEYRIKRIRRDVDDMLCILPFEVDFFESKHHYPVHYVGNPTANEVAEFRDGYSETDVQFRSRNRLDGRPIVALLAGSRRQEIRDNLPMMLRVMRRFPDFQPVLACVPSVDEGFYDRVLDGERIARVRDETYALLSHSTAALVTSGTATLETCCFRVPQVVLYKMPLPPVTRFVWNHFFSVRFFSLVNLIAGREVVAEMLAEKYTQERISSELERILPDGKGRGAVLAGYGEVRDRLGGLAASDNAAGVIGSVLDGSRFGGLPKMQ